MRELEFDDHIVLNDGRKLRVVEIDDEACYAEEIDEKFSERYLIHFEQIEKIVEMQSALTCLYVEQLGYESIFTDNENTSSPSSSGIRIGLKNLCFPRDIIEFLKKVRFPIPGSPYKLKI